MAVVDQQVATDAGPAPDTNVDKVAASEERMYTAAEVESRLRGVIAQSNEAKAKLDAIAADNARAEEARLAEQGKFKELAERAKAEAAAKAQSNEELLAKIAALEEQEAKRLGALNESLEKRRSALPDKLKDLIPDGLVGDALAAHLGKVEQLASVAGQQGILSGAGLNPAGAKTGAEEAQAKADRVRDMIFGKASK